MKNNQFDLKWDDVDVSGFNLILNTSNDKFSYDDGKKMIEKKIVFMLFFDGCTCELFDVFDDVLGDSWRG